jgi:hypothetical protein
MRANLQHYKLDAVQNNGRGGSRGGAQTNRFNKQTDYTKYFMSSSDEEAEIYGIENGVTNGDGEGENIGLTRRDRRAAKRDQKKWDER